MIKALIQEALKQNYTYLRGFSVTNLETLSFWNSFNPKWDQDDYQAALHGELPDTELVYFTIPVKHTHW